MHPTTAQLLLDPNNLPPDPNDPTRDLDDNPRYIVLPGFTSRFLPGTRNIRIYLPAAYLSEPGQRFPVFYLHDAQNLFDPRTSYIPGHTWRASSTADSLSAAGFVEPVILVGIDNNGHRRMAEYTPTRSPQLGGGDGPLYARLLIQELKPLIDATYRTLPNAAKTGLGGSSLGGLISLAIGLQHPAVFGKLAVMSPSLWWNNRDIFSIVAHARADPRPRIWLDMGTSEGLRHLRDTDLLDSRLIHRGWRGQAPPSQNAPPDLGYLRVTRAAHNEDAWAARFGAVLAFLFPSKEPDSATNSL
jgi:predicted alpha/beta superfamily hydrolase